MSRIGKKVIEIDQSKVKVDFKDGLLLVKGPKGESSIAINQNHFQIEQEGNSLVIKLLNEDQKAKHGLYRALIFNMITGVTKGFEKDLELVGIGYRVQLSGRDLQFAIGYSHPVVFKAPEGITFTVEGQNKIKVSGHSKQLVGHVASKIREIRPPEVYKGKGIKYVEEVIIKKQGKSVKK